MRERKREREREREEKERERETEAYGMGGGSKELIALQERPLHLSFDELLFNVDGT